MDSVRSEYQCGIWNSIVRRVGGNLIARVCRRVERTRDPEIGFPRVSDCRDGHAKDSKEGSNNGRNESSLTFNGVMLERDRLKELGNEERRDSV